MKPDFMGRTARILAELRNRTCIDDDAEVLKEILQDELKEYYDELNGYYEEKCCIEISRARNSAYYDGHSDGYSLGYDDGYEEGYEVGHSESHSAV